MPDDDESACDEIYFVMEHCQSDLSKLVKSSVQLEMCQVQFMIWNLIKGLKYLHDRKVVHRDLKPANILVNKDCTVKICDLGFARSVHGLHEQSQKVLDGVDQDESTTQATTLTSNGDSFEITIGAGNFN